MAETASLTESPGSCRTGCGARSLDLMPPEWPRNREDIANSAREGTEYLRAKTARRGRSERAGGQEQGTSERVWSTRAEQVSEYVDRARAWIAGRAAVGRVCGAGKNLVASRQPGYRRQWMRAARHTARPPATTHKSTDWATATVGRRVRSTIPYWSES